jgi:hypothetical protein
MNNEGIKKGVEAFLQVLAKSSTKEGKSSLFSEDEAIHLQFTFTKLPEKVSPFKPYIMYIVFFFSF